jgi:hypothetical protein
MIFEANIAGVPVNLDLATIKPESRDFLLMYGAKQYVQDGAAVSKLHTKKELKGTPKTEEEIDLEKREGVEERVANILSGEFTVRGPAEPKMSPEERERNAVLVKMITDAAAKSKTATPPRSGKNADKAWWDKMTAQVYDKYKASVDKEVARRLKADEKIEIDFTV